MGEKNQVEPATEVESNSSTGCDQNDIVFPVDNRKCDMLQTKQLEQALIDIQADKSRIQRQQEDLLIKVEEKQSENLKMASRLENASKELTGALDIIQQLKKEMVEKDDENIVVHMCVQKLQEELEELTRQLSEKERMIEQKDAYIYAMERRSAVNRNDFPRCRSELLQSLATDQASMV